MTPLSCGPKMFCYYKCHLYYDYLPKLTYNWQFMLYYGFWLCRQKKNPTKMIYFKIDCFLDNYLLYVLIFCRFHKIIKKLQVIVLGMKADYLTLAQLVFWLALSYTSHFENLCTQLIKHEYLLAHWEVSCVLYLLPKKVT